MTLATLGKPMWSGKITTKYWIEDNDREEIAQDPKTAGDRQFRQYRHRCDQQNRQPYGIGDDRNV